MLQKFYIGENNIKSDVAIQLIGRKGYIKPLFIKDAIPKIIRAWHYDGNIIRLA